MLDIKIPIGFMFAIFGVLLTIYGIVTFHDIAMYKKSFDININLWSGIGMICFGGLMLLLSKNKLKK